MADQAQNGRDKGELRGLRSVRDPRLLLDTLKQGKYLPAIYIVAFLILSLLLFPPTHKVKDIRFKEGDIADVDVIAPFTFIVPLSEQEVEINRAKAAVSVPPVYRKNTEVVGLLSNDLKLFFERVEDIAERDTLPEADRIELIRETVPGLKNEPAELLLQGDTRRLMLREGLRLQGRLFEKGIINDASPLRRRDYPHVTVVKGDGEELAATSPMIEQSQLEVLILNKAKKLFGRDEKAIQLFYSVLRSNLVPNLIFSMEETENRREEAKRNVPKAFNVSKNQRIITKHDKVTMKQVGMLEALERRRVALELDTSRFKRIWLYFGKALRIILLTLLLGFALYSFERKMFRETDKLNLLFIIVIFYLLLTALVMRIPYLDPYLIPVAFVSLISAAFFGVLTAVMFTLFSSLMIITHTELQASYFFISLLAGIAAILSISQLRERKNFYTIFLYISLAYIVGIMSFVSTGGISVNRFLMSSLWGITNSFACTILVMFLLPTFESLFDVTTNFTLMELSDLNRSLLRRLIMEAPGTYHHSLMVGNMVETVAQDVNANGLLARVSAYYHDIGKMAKPEYFFENKGDSVNKHEKLTPTMSALILAAHVKEGIELAKKEKLPHVIIDAIREHHGTTVMAYFYQKALEYDTHDSVNIDDFRYPGPRPESKETALIMLADSAEAAVRSLKEPTAPRIKTIVGRIFEARMNDGELDSSGLTLNDIDIIRDKFVQLLTGIFHPRVSYPEQGEEGKTRGQNREGNSKKQSQGERKGRV